MMSNQFELKPYLSEQRKTINQAVEKVLSTFDPGRELTRAMTHSLTAGGKRLRPILCLASAAAAGGDPLLALPYSCALELIHTYSLIHDDLPAMDDDDLRRGQPTCHKQFSEATAILTGDALLTHAFYILSNPAEYFDSYPDPGLRMRLVSLLSAASGVEGMVEGQMMDTHAVLPGKGESLLDHIKLIHGLKTGQLIRASVKGGAISVDADEETIDHLDQYATYIGLAFQVVDDILNVEGNPDIMGKAVGSDQALNKLTFPSIIGLEESKQYAGELIDAAFHALSGFNQKADPLRHIAHYIINRNH
ncbi:MAG: polyprenyl synthetase family protein [Desulfobacteraceae bacterium]|nr:MAG: polyprenyl synthetase family protein [Desulfobacteraceae bacterium]